MQSNHQQQQNKFRKIFFSEKYYSEKYYNLLELDLVGNNL